MSSEGLIMSTFVLAWVSLKTLAYFFIHKVSYPASLSLLPHWLKQSEVIPRSLGRKAVQAFRALDVQQPLLSVVSITWGQLWPENVKFPQPSTWFGSDIQPSTGSMSQDLPKQVILPLMYHQFRGSLPLCHNACVTHLAFPSCRGFIISHHTRSRVSTVQ